MFNQNFKTLGETSWKKVHVKTVVKNSGVISFQTMRKCNYIFGEYYFMMITLVLLAIQQRMSWKSIENYSKYTSKSSIHYFEECWKIEVIFCFRTELDFINSHEYI